MKIKIKVTSKNKYETLAQLKKRRSELSRDDYITELMTLWKSEFINGQLFITIT